MNKREVEAALREAVDPALNALSFAYSRKYRQGWYRDTGLGQVVGVWFQVEPTTRSYLLEGSARDASHSVRCDVGFGPPGKYLYNVAGLENTLRTPFQFLGNAQRLELVARAIQAALRDAHRLGGEVSADSRRFIEMTAGSDDMFFPVDSEGELRSWLATIFPSLERAIAATVEEVRAKYAHE
jgi:hypothetical protein